jgi:hypothetical protein
MLAIIERSEKAVWGIGETEALAHADATKALLAWPNHKPTNLECVQLLEDAPLENDGLYLYRFCMLDSEPPAASQQMGLF